MKVLGRCVDLHRTRKQSFQYHSLFFLLRNVKIATDAATIQAVLFFVILTAKPWRISAELTLIGDVYVSMKMEHGQDIFTHVISRDLARLLSWKMSFVVFQSEPQNMLWSQNISCFLNTTIWPNDVTTVITSLLLKYGNSMIQIISSLTWSIEPEIIRLAPLYKMVNWSNFSLLLRIIIKKFPFLLCQSIIGFKFSPEK